jgi:hypothetical protein
VITAANLTMLIGAWAAAAWSLVVGVPMLARSTFTERVSELHDKIADEVIYGRLPSRDAAVEEFLGVTWAMSNHPRAFGISEAFAVHMTHRELGHVEGCHRPSYNALDADARRLMHDVEEHLTRALRSYLLFGSKFWLPIGALIFSRRVLYKLRKGQPSKHIGATAVPLTVSTEALAEDMREDAKRRLPGLGVGPKVIHV